MVALSGKVAYDPNNPKGFFRTVEFPTGATEDEYPEGTFIAVTCKIAANQMLQCHDLAGDSFFGCSGTSAPDQINASGLAMGSKGELSGDCKFCVIL